MEGIAAITSSTLFSTSTEFFDLNNFQDITLWILIVGFVVAFVLAAGVGANDVANTFGTSVGSGVISIRNACILATIFELLGATLIGQKVSDTIRKGIVDINEYEDSQKDYMLGNLAALGGSAIWLILATFLKMPISGTHSIVGAVLGFSLVAKGANGIKWWTIGKIVGSWFLSPLLSGAVSGAIFWLIRKFILSKQDPIKPGLRSLPIFYGLTVFVNIISVTLDGPDILKVTIKDQAWFETFFGLLVPSVLGLGVATLIYCTLVPKLDREIQQELRGEAPAAVGIAGGNELSVVSAGRGDNGDIIVYVVQDGNLKPASFGTIISSADSNNTNSLSTNDQKRNEANGGGIGDEFPVGSTEMILEAQNPNEDQEGDAPGVGKLFSWLQIMTAAFGSFAHGGNDVSNAIGPLIALWLVFISGEVDTDKPTPIWLLIFGGVGISIGLWVWGRRVIKTMGEDLTKITPSSGFTIEIGAAITVLIASKIGLPVSTTHCKVGSVVTVGQLRTKGGVDWKLFRNIFFAWVVTVPVSGGLSAILMLILQAVA